MLKRVTILLAGVIVLLAAASALEAHCGKCAKDNKNTKKQKLAPLPLKLPRPLFRGTPPKPPKGANMPKPAKGEHKLRAPLMAPVGVKVISRGKPVTASDEDPTNGDLDQVTDGIKDGHETELVEFGDGVFHVQVDLEASHSLAAVIIWHYHAEARVYHDVIIQVADDPDFIENVRTLYNNDHDNSAGLGIGDQRGYYDTFEGLLVDAKGAKARYVRCYSNGSTADDANHVIEVEVWGRPAK